MIKKLPERPSAEAFGEAEKLRDIEYLSPPAQVSMADRWFEIATIDHFWIRRRFDVLRLMAGTSISSAQEMAEIGCGHGMLQRQVEEAYDREVTGFDLNENGLKRNLSLRSRVCCYDIFQMDASLRERFDVIFLFDVLEHMENEDSFLKVLMFHLAPNGKLIVNVPAGQWAYSVYDRAAGHFRRYSARTLRKTAERSRLKIVKWSYWGLPLIPPLLLRKLWLMGNNEQNKIISTGFDSRSPAINRLLGILSRCERIPQKLLGTSLMAILQRETERA